LRCKFYLIYFITCRLLLNKWIPRNFTSTAYVGAIITVETEFNISDELAISGFTFFALGVALGPLFAAPISEIYGRRIIYLCSLPLAMIFIAVGGGSQNFRTLAVSRFFAGLASSPAIAVGAGSISDIWEFSNEPLGGFMALLFVAFNFIGAELGPVASSFVVSDRDWRWSFWVSLMVVGAVFF
jgi:MFS family permease